MSANTLAASRVYVCESAATGDDWVNGRRLVEQFPTYRQAWDRMNEHLRAGRRAFCGEGMVIGDA